jgi:FkbM family methyltransferase
VACWLQTQDVPPQLHFRAVGIAGHDGDETFYLPPRSDWISHSLVRASQYSPESVALPVVRLSEAMRREGHRRVDVLKMDIEGGEYTVIEEIVRQRIPITQLLVEFHHRLSTVGTQKTREALALLESCGMKISYVCPRKEVFTLVRTF